MDSVRIDTADPATSPSLAALLAAAVNGNATFTHEGRTASLPLETVTAFAHLFFTDCEKLRLFGEGGATRCRVVPDGVAEVDEDRYGATAVADVVVMSPDARPLLRYRLDTAHLPSCVAQCIRPHCEDQREGHISATFYCYAHMQEVHEDDRHDILAVRNSSLRDQARVHEAEALVLQRLADKLTPAPDLLAGPGY